MTLSAATSWSVHVVTADVTAFQLLCEPRRDEDPWLLSAALHELLAAGAQRLGRPHAVGAGHGQPILHTQALSWHGCDIELRAQHLRDGSDEVSLTLPCWDDLAALVPDETILWDCVDAVAATSHARWGALGDGEALLPAEALHGDVLTRMLRRHAGLVLPEHVRESLPRALCDVHTVLPRSGMIVVLR